MSCAHGARRNGYTRNTQTQTRHHHNQSARRSGQLNFRHCQLSQAGRASELAKPPPKLSSPRRVLESTCPSTSSSLGRPLSHSLLYSLQSKRLNRGIIHTSVSYSHTVRQSDNQTVRQSDSGGERGLETYELSRLNTNRGVSGDPRLVSVGTYDSCIKLTAKTQRRPSRAFIRSRVKRRDFLYEVIRALYNTVRTVETRDLKQTTSEVEVLA